MSSLAADAKSAELTFTEDQTDRIVAAILATKRMEGQGTGKVLDSYTEMLNLIKSAKSTRQN